MSYQDKADAAFQEHTALADFRPALRCASP